MGNDMSDHFRCFARNRRWGTCVDCPQDVRRDVYPEFCKYTDRYDHHLDVDSLAEQWKRRGGPPTGGPQ